MSSTDEGRTDAGAVGLTAVRSVLVVDDMEDMRTLARINLDADPRWRVVAEANDGREAIDLAAEHQPDVVLLDLEMPWMTGPEAIPHIRKAAERSVIVIWSVDPDGPRARSATDLGAVAIIDKGSTPIPRLAAKLADVLHVA
jgi:chemotaxis response regulator CheB